MNVEDGQKDADTQRPATGKVGIIHFFHMRDGAISGANQSLRIAGDRSLGITKKPDNLQPRRDRRCAAYPERPVQEHRSSSQESSQGPQYDRKNYQLSQPRSRETEPAAPLKAVIFGPEPVAADVAEKLEVPRVNDVVRTIRTLALALFQHGLDVPRTKPPEDIPPQASPGQLHTHAPSAAGLHAARRYRRRQRRHL